jgi:hypothetical protein
MLSCFKIYNNHFLRRLSNSQFCNYSRTQCSQRDCPMACYAYTTAQIQKYQPSTTRRPMEVPMINWAPKIFGPNCYVKKKKKNVTRMLWTYQNTVITATNTLWRNQTLGLCQTEIAVYNTTCPATYHASHKVLLYRTYRRTYSASHKIPCS